MSQSYRAIGRTYIRENIRYSSEYNEFNAEYTIENARRWSRRYFFMSRINVLVVEGCSGLAIRVDHTRERRTIKMYVQKHISVNLLVTCNLTSIRPASPETVAESKINGTKRYRCATRRSHERQWLTWCTVVHLTSDIWEIETNDGREIVYFILPVCFYIRCNIIFSFMLPIFPKVKWI